MIFLAVNPLIWTGFLHLSRFLFVPNGCWSLLAFLCELHLWFKGTTIFWLPWVLWPTLQWKVGISHSLCFWQSRFLCSITWRGTIRKPTYRYGGTLWDDQRCCSTTRTCNRCTWDPMFGLLHSFCLVFISEKDSRWIISILCHLCPGSWNPGGGWEEQRILHVSFAAWQEREKFQSCLEPPSLLVIAMQFVYLAGFLHWGPQ